MSLLDSPQSRNASTAMRDTLTSLRNNSTAYQPRRPDNLTVHAADSDIPAAPQVRVGPWVLRVDPDTGDLLAVHDEGTQRVIATKED